ncbi:TetR/AcrR family transcriptional regulator [Nonomuraea sp. NPDC050556]|uniref:TetR/AcrR family transcriptional regulator n=1 Tax=Nonomuraea sp. NPDC050556 TaxID=3364369 RepID=UPI0037B6C50C
MLQAAVDLLREGGFAAVTHRAVAQKAALPLAATTYYFTSRDHLLAAAFAQLVDDDLTTLRAWTAKHGLARLPHHADRLTQLGLWELYVHAGRDPALQAIARTWTDGCVAIVADTLRLPQDHPQVRLAYALITTAWIEHVVEERPTPHLHDLLKNTSSPDETPQ